ncbi:hypothetical protein ACFL24_02800 [Patescibacteria group bacterium]
MERENSVIEEKQSPIDKQRGKFKEEIGAEQEEVIDLYETEFNSNGENWVSKKLFLIYLIE